MKKIFLSFLLFVSILLTIDSQNLKCLVQSYDNSEKLNFKELQFNSIPFSKLNEIIRANYNLGAEDSLVLIYTDSTDLLRVHHHYAVLHEGIPLDNVKFRVIIENGFLTGVTGKFINIKRSYDKINANDAISLYSKLLNDSCKIFGISTKSIVLFNKSSLSRSSDLLTFCYYEDMNDHIFYKGYRLRVFYPSKPELYSIYINCESGKSYRGSQELSFSYATGTAATRYSGSRSITTEFINNTSLALRRF